MNKKALGIIAAVVLAFVVLKNQANSNVSTTTPATVDNQTADLSSLTTPTAQKTLDQQVDYTYITPVANVYQATNTTPAYVGPDQAVAGAAYLQFSGDNYQDAAYYVPGLGYQLY